ncbi:MAG: metalloprotease [Opitutales bacterium]
MLSFRVLNIPVHVQPWFWLTLGLIGGGLHASDMESIILMLIFIIAGFLSILVHELGHALMIRKYGLPTEIHLIAFGGFATFPQGHLSRKESFLVTAAGPGVQVVLGLLAVVLLSVLPIPEGSLMRPLLGYLVGVSFVWSVLNCLPVFPLDGGQMLSAILGPDNQRTTYLIGTLTAIALAVAGFLVLNSIFLSLFMGYFAYQNWQNYQSVAGR